MQVYYNMIVLFMSLSSLANFLCVTCHGSSHGQERVLLHEDNILRYISLLFHIHCVNVGQHAVHCGDNPNIMESYGQEVAAVLSVKNDHLKIVLKLISRGADMLVILLFTSAVLQSSSMTVS